MSAYVLSVAKNGPKMNPTTQPPGPQARMSRNGQMRVLTFQAAPISYVARLLSQQLKKKVVDETNLQGAFDFKLEWAPDMDSVGPPGAARPASAAPAGPSIFTAIQQQLGLHLHIEKVQVEVYEIDGVQRPSDNYDWAARNARDWRRDLPNRPAI